MTETAENTGSRDRSPAYPIIPLGSALERLVEFEAHFKRSGARPEKIGDAWGIKAKALVDRMAAALRYFGLLEYQAGVKPPQVVISDEGRKYLRAQQEATKQEVVKAAALRPKQIAKFWSEWGSDRPADAACLDDLVLKNSFSESGAREFLKVYDATISYARLSPSDKITPEDENGEEVDEIGRPADENRRNPPPPPLPAGKGKVRLMEGERELTTGLLSKDASFRLVVSGNVGVKEIERLIQKLELDKKILAEQDEFDAGDPEDNFSQHISTAPRDGTEIEIYGRVSPAPDGPMTWYRGRFVDPQGWCFGTDDRLVQIHNVSRWRRA